MPCRPLRKPAFFLRIAAVLSRADKSSALHNSQKSTLLSQNCMWIIAQHDEKLNFLLHVVSG